MGQGTACAKIRGQHLEDAGMRTIKINVSGPALICSNVRVIGGPWRGPGGIVSHFHPGRDGLVTV